MSEYELHAIRAGMDAAGERELDCGNPFKGNAAALFKRAQLLKRQRRDYSLKQMVRALG